MPWDKMYMVYIWQKTCHDPVWAFNQILQDCSRNNSFNRIEFHRAIGSLLLKNWAKEESWIQSVLSRFVKDMVDIIDILCMHGVYVTKYSWLRKDKLPYLKVVYRKVAIIFIMQVHEKYDLEIICSKCACPFIFCTPSFWLSLHYLLLHSSPR